MFTYDLLVPWIAFVATLVPLLFVQRWIHRHLFGVGYLLSREKWTATLLYYLALLPGVMLHEISHYLVGGVFGIPSADFRFMPHTQEDGWLEMGFVELEYIKNPVFAAFVGIAPLLTGILTVVFISNNILNLPIFFQQVGTGDIKLIAGAFQTLFGKSDFFLWAYILFAVANAMMPNREDRVGWWVAAGGFIAALLIMTVIGLGIVVVAWLKGPIAQALAALSAVFLTVLFVDLGFAAVIWLSEALIGRVTGHRVEYTPHSLAVATAAARNAPAKNFNSVYDLSLPIPPLPGKIPAPAAPRLQAEPRPALGAPSKAALGTGESPAAKLPSGAPARPALATGTSSEVKAPGMPSRPAAQSASALSGLGSRPSPKPVDDDEDEKEATGGNAPARPATPGGSPFGKPAVPAGQPPRTFGTPATSSRPAASTPAADDEDKSTGGSAPARPATPGGSPFGKPTTPGGPPLGRPATPAGQPSSPFGRPAASKPAADDDEDEPTGGSAPVRPATPGGSPFGKPATPGGSPLGRPAAPTGQPSSPFGRPAASKPTADDDEDEPTGGGAPARPASPGGSPFGKPATPGASPFGKPATPTGQPSSPFGRPAASKPAADDEDEDTGRSAPARLAAPGGSPFGKPATPGGSPFGKPATPAGQPATPSGRPATPTGQPLSPPNRPATPAGQPSPFGRPAVPTANQPGAPKPGGAFGGPPKPPVSGPPAVVRPNAPVPGKPVSPVPADRPASPAPKSPFGSAPRPADKPKDDDYIDAEYVDEDDASFMDDVDQTGGAKPSNPFSAPPKKSGNEDDGLKYLPMDEE